MAQGLVQNPPLAAGRLLTNHRFLLGFVEAAIPPAFSLLLAMWYKKDEQPLRFSIWVSVSGFGGIVGSIILWGI